MQLHFTPEITDDSTPEGNQPTHILTANAKDIEGGTAAAEYAFQWYADGVPEAGADAKTKTIIATDIGRVITCDITVAEPDGSKPRNPPPQPMAGVIECGLTVGKGVITPNADVQVGDTLTGSAVVTGAQGTN